MSKIITIQDGNLVVDLETTGEHHVAANLTTVKSYSAGIVIEGFGGAGLVGVEIDTDDAVDKSYVGVYNDETGQNTEFAAHGSTYGAGGLNSTFYTSTDVSPLDFLGDYKVMMRFDSTSLANTFVDITDGSRLRIWDDSEVDNVEISHDGADLNFIGTTTADINFTSGITGISIPNSLKTGDAFSGTFASNSEQWISAAVNGVVSMYYNGVQKTFTDQAGFGTNDGLYFAGSSNHGFTPGAGTGALWLDSDDDTLYFRSDAGTDFAVAGPTSGTVHATGSPLNNEIAVFTDGTTLDSDATFTWDTAQVLLSVAPGAHNAAPTIALGDGDTGFYESIDDSLVTSIGGTSRWHATGTLYGSNTGTGGTLQTAASAILPGHTFANDLNTGIGTNAADELSLIAGGVEANRIVAATANTTDATLEEDVIVIAVPTDESFGFEIHVMGYEAATGDAVFERIFGAIRNDGGSTVLVGSTITDRTDAAGATAWVISVEADDTGDALTVDVTGEAAHTIDWKVRVHLLNV